MLPLVHHTHLKSFIDKIFYTFIFLNVVIHENIFNTLLKSFIDKILYTFIFLNVVIHENIFNTLLSVMSFSD